MFSTLLPAVTLVLSFALHVQGHSVITPALGVIGTPVRGDAQRFNKDKPCGTADIAKDLVASNSVAADATGKFTVNVVDFNAGVDGSQAIETAQVDPTGKGENFVPMTIVTNGIKAPNSVGSSSVTVQLPPNTKCTGGDTGNLCVASFETDGGFGNCVAVSTGGAAAPAGAANAGGNTGAADASTTADTPAATPATPAVDNSAAGGATGAQPAANSTDSGNQDKAAGDATGDADKKKKKHKHGDKKKGDKNKDGDKQKDDKAAAAGGNAGGDNGGDAASSTTSSVADTATPAAADSATSTSSALANEATPADDTPAAAQRRNLDGMVRRGKEHNPLQKSGKVKGKAHGKDEKKKDRKQRKGGKQRQDKKKKD